MLHALWLMNIHGVVTMGMQALELDLGVGEDGRLFVLGNVLLESPESGYSCGRKFDACQLPT